MFIDEEIDFIKSQIAHHQRSVEHFHSRRDHQKANRHSGILRRFEDILPKMIRCQNLDDAAAQFLPTFDSKKIGSRFGDMSDLPPELTSQMVSIQFDETEQRIINVIKKSYSGVASIDEILVGLYRLSGEIEQRDALANKIYRMTRKEMLHSVVGRKGVYTTDANGTSAEKDSDTETLSPDS